MYKGGNKVSKSQCIGNFTKIIGYIHTIPTLTILFCMWQKNLLLYIAIHCNSSYPVPQNGLGAIMLLDAIQS